MTKMLEEHLTKMTKVEEEVKPLKMKKTLLINLENTLVFISYVKHG